MKKYRVWALEETEWEWPTIEAEDEDQAKDIANSNFLDAKNVELSLIHI